jgi:methylthioribose-1-phosphate isomerase
MKHAQVRMLAVIGGSAIVAMGAIGMAVGQEHTTSDAVISSGMSTGATVTQSTPPTALATSAAVPSIKGPAPLPPEEQGLPG